MWSVPEIQNAPTGINPGILHDSQDCYQVEPRVWGLLRFWKILSFNNFGFYNSPSFSLSLSFPPEFVDWKEKSEHERQLLRAAGYSTSKIYALGEKNWNAAIGKRRASFNFFDVYNYDSHHFIATEATHLKTKQQESEWSHSPFGSDQNGPQALISACVQWVQLTGLYHWQMGLYWKPPLFIFLKIHWSILDQCQVHIFSATAGKTVKHIC